jgi:hypothetical protein
LHSLRRLCVIETARAAHIVYRGLVESDRPVPALRPRNHRVSLPRVLAHQPERTPPGEEGPARPRPRARAGPIRGRVGAREPRASEHGVPLGGPARSRGRGRVQPPPRLRSRAQPAGLASLPRVLPGRQARRMCRIRARQAPRAAIDLLVISHWSFVIRQLSFEGPRRGSETIAASRRQNETQAHRLNFQEDQACPAGCTVFFVPFAIVCSIPSTAVAQRHHPPLTAACRRRKECGEGRKETTASRPGVAGLLAPLTTHQSPLTRQAMFTSVHTLEDSQKGAILSHFLSSPKRDPGKRAIYASHYAARISDAIDPFLQRLKAHGATCTKCTRPVRPLFTASRRQIETQAQRLNFQ